MIADEDDVLEAIDDDELGGEVGSSQLLENRFGVEEDDGKIVMTRRPGARLDAGDALNLAAWIVAESGIELADFEEMVRHAIEGRE